MQNCYRWPVPGVGYLEFEKRLLSEKEWQLLMDYLETFKPSLIAAEQPRAADGLESSHTTAPISRDLGRGDSSSSSARR